MIHAASLPLRVARIEPLSPTLRRLRLVHRDGLLLPTSLPGAHLSLALPTDPRPLRNAYSIVSGADERTHYELIVRRTETSRGGSHHIHDRLAEGDLLDAAAPNSQFVIRTIARRHVLIAGGIGLTPFLSYLHAFAAVPARFELHLFARPDEVALFEDMLDARRDHRIHVHAGRGGPDMRSLLERQPLGTHVYTCGPAALMEDVDATARTLGWPAGRIHLESFGAAGGRPFRLRLARSGLELAVGEHQTMLEALEEHGLPVPSLCRGGACGECVTTVLDGKPEHRDHFLDPAERAGGRLVMPCVSRAETDLLTLDL